MELEIRLFATLRDRAGQERINVSLDEEASVQTMLLEVEKRYPSLAEALPTVLVAVNKSYAGTDHKLSSGDEVALFPPVSGGDVDKESGNTYLAIIADKVDLNQLHSRLTRPDIGAIVTFSGSVRGETQRENLPAETLHLEYQAYEEMAMEKMAQIAREIRERWPLVKGVAIVQRIGKLDVGETTTIVACAAAHRDQGAFEAARFGIDRLKEIVPVWKKEVGRDKSIWVEGDYRPTAADN